MNNPDHQEMGDFLPGDMEDFLPGDMEDFLPGINFTDDEEDMLQLLENMGGGEEDETVTILREAIGLKPTPAAQPLPNPTTNNILELKAPPPAQVVPRKRMWPHIAPSEKPVHQAQQSKQEEWTSFDVEELTVNDEPRMEFSMEPCDEPSEQDVICERGGRSNHHPRNKQYLDDKDRLQTRYMASPAHIKTVISRMLVNSVLRSGGRFLKLNKKDEKWYPLVYNKARKKASQALREINTPKVRAAKRARVKENKLKRERQVQAQKMHP